ncbi:MULTISPECIES: FecCD family ABC transporter permease [Geobacillus]|jgi:iron complex transport system permease protein|nr:iron ABC transporter permease [Geobacillus thermodenitrificans]ATO39011.1 iron ABC transporter permease [Geobacillus thermodenitrificans]
MILVAIYISLTNGVFDLSVQDVLKTLLRMDPVPEHDLVILDFRLPRIVIAALVGFGLGVAGATIQGISRNGLADPGILGINAGAGAMIVIFMLFFGGRRTAESDWLSILAMPLFGWAGGLGAALLIYLFARQNGRLDTQRLILVGIAAGAGFGAVSLYLSLKMNPQDFEMATVWLAGSIWNANWQYVVAMLPWMILLVPIIISKAYILDLFQLGEERAKGLGVSTEKEKNLLLLASIGIVSACVSVSGNIGFVGLIAPHIAKRLVGVHHQRVIPISGTIGMLLVVVSDFIAKTVFAPVELSVGIVIAIIGIPYFVYLLFKTKV